MSAINNKYFRGSKRGYVPMIEKKIFTRISNNMYIASVMNKMAAEGLLMVLELLRIMLTPIVRLVRYPRS